jgi:hypothetical protein
VEAKTAADKKKASDFARRFFNLIGTTSVQLNRRNGKLCLELSNATSSICWIFVLLFDEAHKPKVVSSNLPPQPIQESQNKRLP